MAKAVLFLGCAFIFNFVDSSDYVFATFPLGRELSVFEFVWNCRGADAQVFELAIYDLDGESIY
jgi:hypothetical protein